MFKSIKLKERMGIQNGPSGTPVWMWKNRKFGNCTELLNVMAIEEPSSLDDLYNFLKHQIEKNTVCSRTRSSVTTSAVVLVYSYL